MARNEKYYIYEFRITIRRFFMKGYILNVLLFLVATTAGAAANHVVWHEDPSLPRTHAKPLLQPGRFRSFVAGETELQAFFSLVSDRYDQGVILFLPAPDGTLRAFRVWRTAIMEDGLATHFPEIVTFTAEAVGNRQVTAKLD